MQNVGSRGFSMRLDHYQQNPFLVVPAVLVVLLMIPGLLSIPVSLLHNFVWPGGFWYSQTSKTKSQTDYGQQTFKLHIVFMICCSPRGSHFNWQDMIVPWPVRSQLPSVEPYIQHLHDVEYELLNSDSGVFSLEAIQAPSFVPLVLKLQLQSRNFSGALTNRIADLRIFAKQFEGGGTTNIGVVAAYMGGDGGEVGLLELFLIYGSALETSLLEIFQQLESEPYPIRTKHTLLKEPKQENESHIMDEDVKYRYRLRITTKVWFQRKHCMELSLRWNHRKIVDISLQMIEAKFSTRTIQWFQAEAVPMITYITRSMHQDIEWKYFEGVTIQVLQQDVGSDIIGGTLYAVVAILQHTMTFLTIEAKYMRLTIELTEDTWLKGLYTKSGFKPRVLACIATSALTKAIPCLRHFKTLSLDELRSPDFNLLSDQEYSEEEEAEAMAETMEQYMSKTRTEYGLGVARPKIDNKDQFELKGQFLKELRENTFSGSDNEDANKHIEKVLEIVDLFHVPNITVDQLMLRVFPISLSGAASHWLRNELTGSIKTWEDLKTKFLNKYCPPGQTTKKMEEINNFQRESDETLYQAWECVK
ncbi:retrovirus-related pol polyprotein from transposon TNT 1-94 [Tanacetum coccineum]